MLRRGRSFCAASSLPGRHHSVAKGVLCCCLPAFEFSRGPVAFATDNQESSTGVMDQASCSPARHTLVGVAAKFVAVNLSERARLFQVEAEVRLIRERLLRATLRSTKGEGEQVRRPAAAAAAAAAVAPPPPPAVVALLNSSH
eukprot:3164459-Pyramimonas_sp.AAC.1